MSPLIWITALIVGSIIFYVLMAPHQAGMKNNHREGTRWK